MFPGFLPSAPPGDVAWSNFVEANSSDTPTGDCIVTLHAEDFTHADVAGVRFSIQIEKSPSVAYVLIGNGFDPGDPVTVTTGADGLATQTIATDLPEGCRYLVLLSKDPLSSFRQGEFARFYITPVPGEHDVKDLIDNP